MKIIAMGVLGVVLMGYAVSANAGWIQRADGTTYNAKESVSNGLYGTPDKSSKYIL